MRDLEFVLVNEALLGIDVSRRPVNFLANMEGDVSGRTFAPVPMVTVERCVKQPVAIGDVITAGPASDRMFAHAPLVTMVSTAGEELIDQS